MKRFIIFVLIFFNASNLNAECNYKKVEQELLIKNLEINIDNSRKFFKKISETLIKDFKNEKIVINKKRYKASITVNYKNGNSCSFLSKVRVHGDFLDHIEIIDGFPIPSLRVNLRDGNINGITNFKLLRPRTRYFSNEIFATTLFKFLGFLSPRTFYVNVKVGDKMTLYIFQESLKKEFIENNNLIEGPILESKEDFSNDYLQMARVSNSEWIKDNYNKFQVSLNAIKEYNLQILNSYKFRTGINEDETLRFKNPGSEKFFKINKFDALMYGIGAAHGLSYDDRRFYYDSIYSKMEPIYYDGMSKILSTINYNPYNGKYENLYFAPWKKIEELFFDYKKNHTRSKSERYRNPVVTKSAIHGSKNMLEHLQNINRSDLLLNLKNNGLKKFDKKKLDLVLSKIIIRLKKINNYQNSFDEQMISFNNQIYKSYEKNMGLNQKVKLYFLTENQKLKNNYDLKNIEICDYNLQNCKIKKINFLELDNIINQKSFNDDYLIFIGMNKQQYLKGEFGKVDNDLKNVFTKKQIGEKINLFHNSNIKIYYNKEENILNLDYLKNSGRVIIYDSELDKLKINLNNSSIKENIRFENIFSLTGCLTILDSNLIDLEINAADFNCEDTVNIIRSIGSVKKVDIDNSKSDGLDIDFSSIKIENLIVSNSMNDCADFSFGKYFLINAILNDCGDKGISVGESSSFNIKNLFVKNSNSGFVSKDSSISEIDVMDMSNLDNCLAAYNKKQEFGYGKILINKFICKDFNNKVIVDDGSTIDIMNEI